MLSGCKITKNIANMQMSTTFFYFFLHISFFFCNFANYFH